jgi:hypothetical protein
MAELYYVRDGRGAVTGPHTAEEIERQARAGRLPPSWYISTDRVCWVPVHQRGQAAKASGAAVDPFEALFAPPAEADRPSLWHEVRRTWLWYTRPQWFLRATAGHDGWRYTRHDVASGRETALATADADRIVAEAARAFPWFGLFAGFLVVLWLVWALSDFGWGSAVFEALVLLLVAGIARFWKRKWRTLFIAYEMDAEERSRLQAVRNAFATLRRCSRIWLAPPGSGAVALRKLPAVALDRPVAGMAINVRVPGFVSGDLAVHFLPDKVLVLDHTGVRFVSPQSCTVTAEQVEADAPEGPLFRDAEIVSRRPALITPPDPSSSDRPGPPVVRVGLLRLGLGEKQVEVLTSDPQAPERFRNYFFSMPAAVGEAPIGEEALARRSTTAVLGEAVALWWWRFRCRIWPALRWTTGSVPGRLWLGAVGLVLAALLVAVLFWWAGAGDRDIALADQLWEKGDYAAAVALYKQYPAYFWRLEGEGRRKLWQVVSYDLDHGRREEAARWIDRALEHGVRPVAVDNAVNDLYAERQAERSRRQADAAAQRKQREAEDEERRRQAEDDALRPQREREARERAEQEERDRAMMEEARRKREERERLAEEEKRRRPPEEEDEQLQAAETKAAPNLRYARDLIDRGMVEKGIERLKEIVKEYPGTPSAIEAKKLLREFGEK